MVICQFKENVFTHVNLGNQGFSSPCVDIRRVARNLKWGGGVETTLDIIKAMTVKLPTF